VETDGGWKARFVRGSDDRLPTEGWHHTHLLRIIFFFATPKTCKLKMDGKSLIDGNK
jgi:hypothetical protein